MGLNRIALLVSSMAAAGCASAATPASEPPARTSEAAPAEPPPAPATPLAPAAPPTVDVPPATADVLPPPPEAPPSASAESAPADPQSANGNATRLDHLDDREKPLALRDAVKGTATISSVSVSGAAVSNAPRVVAGMRAGFRQCYNRSLQKNPKSQGAIRLTIEVHPDGAVQSVTSAPTGTLSEGSVACVTARARAAQFSVTGGGSATVFATVTFAP